MQLITAKKAQEHADLAVSVEITHQILIFQDANYICKMSACPPF